jgi:site-specific recombinase XerD
MKDKQELLKEFLEEERIAGGRTQGIIGLRKRVPRLFGFVEEQGLMLGGLRARHARSYQGMLLASKTKGGKSYSKKTVAAYITAAVSFYDFLKRKGLSAANPFKEIRKVRVDKKLPGNILKEKEMNAFLEKLARFDQEANLKRMMSCYKVHVIAELQYAAGLRISEAAELTVEDIDFVGGLVTVREGKGGAARIAYLNEYARDVLKLYVERIRPYLFSAWNMRNKELLFGVRWGWLGHVVNGVLQSKAREAGFEGFCSHGFRHALGFHLLRSGCNIRYIQSILGHKRLRNTEIYTKVDKEDLKEILDAFHPRSMWRKAAYEKA